MIRLAGKEDAAVIAQIYNYYVLNDFSTFEEQVVSEQEMQARIEQVSSDKLPWLVVLAEQKVVGYAYASRWRTRSAYRHSVEISVYLDHAEQGKGLGAQLYEALFDQLRSRPVHTVVGGITLPNPASIGLHEKFGLSKVAHFKEIGYKFGKRQDVGYWQIILGKDLA